MTKRETIERAALRLRVFARKHNRPVTENMAWDAIAEVGSDYPVSAKDVLRVARRQLRGDDERHLI